MLVSPNNRLQTSIYHERSISQPALIYLLTGKRSMQCIIGQDDVLIFGGQSQSGGLAVPLSSLSFPQHLYRWLQLLTDHCCNRLVSDREKARLCPQNIISCLWEVWALLIKLLGWAAQIDCQDAVMSDSPGWREKLNPVMVLLLFSTVTSGSWNRTYHNPF